MGGVCESFATEASDSWVDKIFMSFYDCMHAFHS